MTVRALLMGSTAVHLLQHAIREVREQTGTSSILFGTPYCILLREFA